jgi:hypothetical protein
VLAAEIAMAGMDPMRFLESEDPVEVSVMLAIAKSWTARKLEFDRSLAMEIINMLGKSMKG